MFQDYSIFNAVTFFIIFLVILEALNFAMGEQSPEKTNPQYSPFLISVILGIVSGFKVKNLTSYGG